MAGIFFTPPLRTISYNKISSKTKTQPLWRSGNGMHQNPLLLAYGRSIHRVQEANLDMQRRTCSSIHGQEMRRSLVRFWLEAFVFWFSIPFLNALRCVCGGSGVRGTAGCGGRFWGRDTE